MIPIIYEGNETAFNNNGLGRLRDCISCVCTEERNGLYEVDFEYPISGTNYDLIKVGRIVGVTHDDDGDIQPFDIVSFERPIDGIVTFHCTHISYRQSYLTVTGSDINSLADALTMLSTATPDNPFTYVTDKTSTGYMGAADGLPKTVRSMLGGTEGSILDTYGGEYEWDGWTVNLHSARGVDRDFSIRYGVNMLDYNEEYDSTGVYSSVVPYWTDGTDKVVGNRVDSLTPTATRRGECVPLDVSEKFESKPTQAQVEAAGLAYMNSNDTFIPKQSIHVEFVRLQDMPEIAAGFQNLFKCNLCDTVNVVFPDYDSAGRFKIVKTTWDVLRDRYESMELGDLSITLAEALGVSSSSAASVGGMSVLDFYPVGSYYETSDTTFNPNTAWGGTWVLETAGQVHVSAGTSTTSTVFTVNGANASSGVGMSDGGEEKHWLTVDEMPTHNHGYYYTGSGTGTKSLAWWSQSGNGLSYDIVNTGGNQTHNTMQPYIVVNRWHRTA